MHRRYRLYIDESGDHSYGRKEIRRLRVSQGQENVIDASANHYPELEAAAKRYLGLTGCVVEAEYYRSAFHPKFEELKQKFFPHNPDEPVILHRKDIINKSGPFWRLRDPEYGKSFNEGILLYLTEMEYTVITVVIDKKAHIERYESFAYHPYHFCLAAMLERYCGLLHFHNAHGDVMAESRGGTEDRQLKDAYRNIYNSGTQYRKSDFFQQVLTSSEIKLKTKTANIAGLQVADLLAYPLKQEILFENKRIHKSDGEVFGQRLCQGIQGKHNRQQYSGMVYGYGKVFIK
jgi:hypothetical protein